jgi:hypothetical protein
VGYESVYSVNDDRVEKVMVIYEPGLTDKLIDRVMRTFIETKFRKVNSKMG